SSARAASKKSNQEMIVFFSKKTCSNCDGAWMAYSKDMKATQQYVSTRMDIEDFDGGVFYEMLDLKEVPSWVVFTADGKEKERWNGGWKDASGSPVLFDKSTQVVVEKETIKTSAPSNSVATKNDKPATNPSGFPQETAPVSKPVTTSAPEKITQGFVVQAGYFGSEANANKMMQDLTQKGYSNFEIKTLQQNGTTFFRIISDVHNTEAEANDLMQNMNKAGLKTSIKKTSEI
ncbi:MAG: SPOR domain-containing protein, partial [Bacteroidota bacterium]|nr:SPOR domain-containing protein [Bacteroidota bacterium]